MRLFTSRQFCGLPGLVFPGSPNDFPTAHEMGEYLIDYARHFKLNVREHVEVVCLEKDTDGFIVNLSDGSELIAKSVINATGSNQKPYVPLISKELSDEVMQFDSSLKSLSDLPDNSCVAIVGDGATGRQIASGLASRCDVTLSTGRSRALPSNIILGRDIFWWLKKLGILYADRKSIVAKILQRRNPVPCGQYNNKKLSNSGVKIVGRTVNCSGHKILLEDGNAVEIDAVIWTSGYRDDTQWLSIENCKNEKGFVHDYGVTPEPGLYIIGRKWLSCRASELVLGVERDVQLVLRQLQIYLCGIT